MGNAIVLGAQFGDEGKGKIIDLLSAEYDYVVRYQGGNNAGHTVVYGNKTYKFHLIPSGVLQGKMCVLGNGVVIDADVLLHEMGELGTAFAPEKFVISEKAHVILFYDKLLDATTEMLKGETKLGTTGRGIGPSYANKISRNGIRCHDLCNETSLKEKLWQNIDRTLLLLKATIGEKKLKEVIKQEYTEFYDENTIVQKESVLHHYLHAGNALKRYIKDATALLHEALLCKQRILWEGAQGTMLDVDHGTYPFVTSSNASIGGAFTGTGVFAPIEKRIGVMKAYLTRVGNGAFPTELHDEIGNHLQIKGKEVGTTTGRKRRCGWLDIVQLKYAHMINNFTELALTKLDVLSGLQTIKICIAYECDEKRLDVFPADTAVLEKCKPVYLGLPGWNEDISHIKNRNDLPKNAQSYLKKIEELLGLPITLISVGPDREQTINHSPLVARE